MSKPIVERIDSTGWTKTMKPTQPSGFPRLLSVADSARIRDLRNEKASIIARLEKLKNREIARLVEPRIPPGQMLVRARPSITD
jgi:hypothetical protein